LRSYRRSFLFGTGVRANLSPDWLVVAPRLAQTHRLHYAIGDHDRPPRLAATGTSVTVGLQRLHAVGPYEIYAIDLLAPQDL
jgi:hypothetical protein